MKLVIEQYASAIIATWIGLVVITVIMGTNSTNGIPQLLGQVLVYSIDDTSIRENEAFKQYMTTLPPTINEKKVYLVAGESILLSDYFEAKSSNGNLLPVYVKEIWDERGVELTAKVSEDATRICLERSGCYWLHIYACDENRKKCERMVRVLVNER